MPTALPPALPAQVLEACRMRLGLEPSDAVLVAVSGGADSTALAALLSALAAEGLPLRLVLAHVDHGWRGAPEAAADVALLEALAAQLGLPLVTAGPPPPELPRTEADARRFRYRELSRLAMAHGCRAVATGHHVGDQAETFLMRLLRGSGLVGLAGIPWQRPLHPNLTVIRPLLEVEPEVLRAWLEAKGIPWREDVTNQDVSRDRAAMRARLERTHARTLAELAGRLRRRLEFRLRRIETQAAHSFVYHRLAGAVAMPRRGLEPMQGEDLALALRLAGAHLEAERDGPWFTRRHVERFQALLVKGGAVDLPGDLFLHVAGKTAWLARRTQPQAELPGLRVTTCARAEFDLEAWSTANAAGRAAVDAEVLGEAPVLRLLRPEDRFTPRGSRRAQRVSAWLSRQGVPAFVRRGQVVIAGERGVAWVLGQRIDAHHAVEAGTRSVAILEVE